METFTPPRRIVDNPRFARDREATLARLVLQKIDAPIRDLVASFAKLPCCCTVHSCYGHFVHAAQPERDNLGVLLDRSRLPQVRKHRPLVGPELIARLSCCKTRIGIPTASSQPARES